MKNAEKLQRTNNFIASRIDGMWFVSIAGTVLIVILAGLTGFNPSMALQIAIVLFLLVLIIPRPVLIVYGLALMMPLTGGLARGAVVPVLRLGQALIVFAFILFLLAKPSPQGKVRLTAIDLAFALFFMAQAVFPVLALYYRGEHLNLNDTHNIYGVSPLQTLLGPLLYYLLYRIVVATISSERQVKVVLELSFIASIIVSTIGILERVVPSIRTLIETYYPPIGSTNSLGRVASTLDFYSGLGSYLAFTIIIALTCYAFGKRVGIPLQLLVTTIILGSITLLLTGTFAAWIGLVVGVAAVFMLIRRLPKLVFFILFAIVLAAILFQPFFSARFDQQLGAGAAQGLVPQSLAFRIQLWQQLFLPAIGQHLLFGSGPAPAVLNYWSTEESQYLYFLLRGGLVFFFSYLFLIGAAIVACCQEIKRKSSDVSQSVAIALLVIFIALNVMNVSGQYFSYVGGTQTLWVLLAIVIADRQFKALRPLAAEQTRNGRWRVGKTSLHKPLKEITTSLVGESADSLPTRNDASFDICIATRPFRKDRPLKKRLPERSDA